MIMVRLRKGHLISASYPGSMAKHSWGKRKGTERDTKEILTTHSAQASGIFTSTENETAMAGRGIQ